MRVLLAVLLLLISGVTCREITRPAYFVGDASYAVVIDSGGLPTQFYRIGEPFKIALPGESLCVHFQADGNWQKLVLWNDMWPRLELQWIPHDVVRHVTLYFSAGWRMTETGATTC